MLHLIIRFVATRVCIIPELVTRSANKARYAQVAHPTWECRPREVARLLGFQVLADWSRHLRGVRRASSIQIRRIEASLWKRQAEGIRATAARELQDIALPLHLRSALTDRLTGVRPVKERKARLRHYQRVHRAWVWLRDNGALTTALASCAPASLWSKSGRHA
jgi:hypothetical protein